MGNNFKVIKSFEDTIRDKFSYDAVKKFKNGMSIAASGGKWFHINLEGLPINDGRYLEARRYHEGVCVVKDVVGWYYVDINGVDLTPHIRYLSAEKFENGISIVKDFNSRYKIINSKFEPLTAGEGYRYIFKFNKFGFTIASHRGNDSSGRSSLIDRTGKVYNPDNTSYIRMDKERGLVIYAFNHFTKKQTTEIFNIAEDRTVTSGQFENIFYNAGVYMAELKGSGKYVIIDPNGNVKGDIEFITIKKVKRYKNKKKNKTSIKFSELFAFTGSVSTRDGVKEYGITRESEAFCLGNYKK